MEVLQIIIPLLIFLLLIVPSGKYLYSVITGEKSFIDPVFNKIDGFIYKIAGIKQEEMNWKQYSVSLIITNAVIFVIAFILLLIQGALFLNPNRISSMNPALAFNTAVSFITNTNMQNYSGESAVTYLSQMVVMTFLMFVSAATGFSAAAAFMRGITGKKGTLGNYYVDMTRIITRVLVPLSIVVGIFLVSQGVPQTLRANKTVNTLENKFQSIAVGPVASLESIKHIGTNGGGFFNANSSHPFENPTPITNVVEILCMMLIPGSLVFTFGLMLKNKKQGWSIFAAMAILFVIMVPVSFMAESSQNPALKAAGIANTMGNMQGKELRFGAAGTSLFTNVTTAFTTGSVNSSLDSAMPLGVFTALWNMMLNVVFGGKGVGFMNMIMYAIITVFLAGLMVGRTPEYLGKKIEGKEIKLIALAILIHPFIILMPSAFTLLSKMGNPGFHGLTEVIYQYTSAAANNGSALSGLFTGNSFWNITTGIVMILGRYISVIILLAVAGSLAAKSPIPETSATFRTDNATFVVILICVVVIVGALTFLPALTLGPLTEHLILKR